MDSQLSSQRGHALQYPFSDLFQFQTLSRRVSWPSFGFTESEAVTEDPSPPHFRFAVGGNAKITQKECAAGANVPVQPGYFSY